MNNLKIFLIICFCCFTATIDAQEIKWQNTIGGNNTDFLESIYPTSDGGVICGGWSVSPMSGDKTETPVGHYDYWIVKLDAAGNIQWQNSIGGDLQDNLTVVQQTSDGGYVCGGYSISNSSGDKNLSCIGAQDYWIVRLDSIGNILWEKTTGGTDSDRLTSIDQTSDGGFICGGYSTSGISGYKTEACLGGPDYWIVKLYPNGNVQWQNTIGGNNNDVLNSIQQTSDGGYICGGYSRSDSSSDKSENPLGALDYWIVKLDSAGSIEWDNTIGGFWDDILTSIYQDTDGGYIVGGHSSSQISGDKIEGCTGGDDYWILKLDDTGNIQWQNTIGGDFWDYLETIIPLQDGGYICSGVSNSPISRDKTENDINENDFWILKLDTAGQIIWQNTIGGDSWEYIGCSAITSDGDFILAGYSLSEISGDKTEDSNGSHDYWVMKLAGKSNLIEGNVFGDFNANQIFESGEQAVINNKIQENNSGIFAFTDYNGFYSMAVFDTGNFQIAPLMTGGYYNNLPLDYSINFSNLLQVDSLNDFALQPTGSYNDLCISITPTGNFRSGMNASYMLSYFNVGTTSIANATVVFYPDTNVSYFSSSLSPVNITADSVVFSIGTLTPFQTGQIIITVMVDAGLPIGSLINSSVAILPMAGDVDPGCNIAYWEVLTTGSFDPNDILVNRNFLYDYELPAEPYLEYIIRFQNTGNDTAFTVKVLNPIDTTRLQLSTLEIVATSHPAAISWTAWERNMHFQFDNILLPDSNLNEILSHGFIKYKIKPKTNLLVGDSINNRAAIYFDFNDPVLTNNANTEIILFTGIHETNNSTTFLNIYPNPASTLLNIIFEQGMQKNNSFELYNVFGQKMQNIETKIAQGNNFIKTIDISHLATGVYFLKWEGNSSVVKKFVKY